MESQLFLLFNHHHFNISLFCEDLGKCLNAGRSHLRAGVICLFPMGLRRYDSMPVLTIEQHRTRLCTWDIVQGFSRIKSAPCLIQLKSYSGQYLIDWQFIADIKNKSLNIADVALLLLCLI